MKKFYKIIILILSFTLFSTYFPNLPNNKSSYFFPIKNIEIENNKIIKKDDLIRELKNLIGKNLLFINPDTVKLSILKFNFISSFKIKKIYPSTIKLIITEKIPVAIYNDGKKIYYLIKNGELIDYTTLENYSNLPSVIGKEFNFKDMYHSLKNSKFPIEEIESFHYFEIGRWNLNLKKNVILKLPEKKYNETLINFIKIKDNKSFEKYKIFDYRIKNKLILK